MIDTNKIGIKGEKFAVKYLKKNKYKILLRNFSCHLGEIDIIARNDKYIVFVEVKTRNETSMILPRASVDYKKQENITSTANYFMRKYKTDLTTRFDIAEVIYDSKGKMKINYLENAFIYENNLNIY